MGSLLSIISLLNFIKYPSLQLRHLFNLLQKWQVLSIKHLHILVLFSSVKYPLEQFDTQSPKLKYLSFGHVRQLLLPSSGP